MPTHAIAKQDHTKHLNLNCPRPQRGTDLSPNAGSEKGFSILGKIHTDQLMQLCQMWVCLNGVRILFQLEAFRT